MEAYHQQQAEEEGEVLSIDGKALWGTRKGGEERSAEVLSGYGGQSQRIKAKEMIEYKENEISAARRALRRVDLAGKIVTRDAMQAQRGLSEQILKGQGHYL